DLGVGQFPVLHQKAEANGNIGDKILLVEAVAVFPGVAIDKNIAADHAAIHGNKTVQAVNKFIDTAQTNVPLARSAVVATGAHRRGAKVFGQIPAEAVFAANIGVNGNSAEGGACVADKVLLKPHGQVVFK